MNPLSTIKDILGSVAGKIDDIIDHMPKRRTKSIKQGFFFAIVILMTGGAFWGYRLGGGAAGIKAPPLATTVRDVFEYEIYKERGEGGNLDLMIESERMSGQETKAADKITFPAREPFGMEYEGGIVDYKHVKRPTTPEMEMNYQPLDGKYAEPIGRIEPQVTPLNRTLDSTKPETGISKNDIPKTDTLTIDIPKTDSLKTEPEKADVPVAEKRVPENQNKDFPKPITDGTGIVE